MKTSRRTFLKASTIAPALGVRSTVTPASGIRDSSFDPWVEIDAGNLRHNVAEIGRRVGGRPILAVIKSNGYGSGVSNVANAIEPLAAIHGFAVVKLHEAVALREAGVRKPILLLGPFDTRELVDIVANEILPMVYTPIGDALDATASRVG